MTEDKQKILVYDIVRIHPKIVTVKIADDTQVILPIKTPMHNRLIHIADCNPRGQKWYPIIFWLDEKGYVTDLLPYKTWKERQAEKEAEAEEEELKELMTKD